MNRIGQGGRPMTTADVEVIQKIVQDAEDQIEKHLFNHLNRDSYIAQAEAIFSDLDRLKKEIIRRDLLTTQLAAVEKSLDN